MIAGWCIHNSTEYRLLVLPIADITPDLFKKLKRLTLGHRGLMSYYLQSAYQKEKTRLNYRKDEQAIILVRRNVIKSWALLLSFRRKSRSKWKKVIRVYTRSRERNKGYAHALIKAARMIVGDDILLFCVGNSNFFKKYGIKYAR